MTQQDYDEEAFEEFITEDFDAEIEAAGLPDWEEEDYTTPNKQTVFNAWVEGEVWAERIMIQQNWETEFLERLR